MNIWTASFNLYPPPLPFSPPLTHPRQVVEQGPPPVVRSFLEGLERDLGPSLSGLPLYEPLFQLMCHPVCVCGGGYMGEEGLRCTPLLKSHLNDMADDML